jgi:hypothetical protein
MIRKGIQTAAGAVSTITIDSAAENQFAGALTTTTNNTGTLAITGGANKVTIASAVGSSDKAFSALKVVDYTKATFSSAIYDRSISLTGEETKGLSGKDAEKKDNDGYISSDESVVESVEEDDDAPVGVASEIDEADIKLSPGVVKLAEGIDVTGVIDNPSRGTGYLEFNPPLQFVSEANPASANNDGILEIADGQGTLGLSGSTDGTITIGTALNPANATSQGTLGLTGSANRTINATFGASGNAFSTFNLGGTGTQTFASGSGEQYFTKLTFDGASASKATFAGGGSITDKVSFADGPLLTFARASTPTGGSDFAGNDATLIIDSTAFNASLSGGTIADSSGDSVGAVSIIGGKEVVINNLVGIDADHRVGAVNVATGATSDSASNIYIKDSAFSGTGGGKFDGEVYILGKFTVASGTLNFNALVDIPGATLDLGEDSAVDLYSVKTGDAMYAGSGVYHNANDAALIATAEDVIKETDVVLGGLGGDHSDVV